MMVISLENGYAGTLDAVCTIRKHPKRRKHESLVGKTVILDLKTNKDAKVYTPDNLLQVDAYREALLEMGYERDIDGELVLAVGPERYTPCLNYYPRGTFHTVLKCFNALEEAKSMNPNGRKK
jgi:hypothetical protein